MLAIVDLPAPERPVNQRIAGFCRLSAARSALPISSGCQWILVPRRSAELDHAGADGAVGEAIDDDEGAGLAVLGVRVEGDRRGRRDVAKGDVVERRASSRPSDRAY